MTTPQRWALIASAITALAVALPAAAQADTSPPPTATAPAVPPVAICSSPTPTTPTTNQTTPTTDQTAPTTNQTTVEPVPCVDAAGNVYIFYVITTTTTTTPINAPIITANGPITWVSGSPVTDTVGPSTTSTSLAYPYSISGGAFSCVPIAGTTSMVCSLGQSGSTSNTAIANGGKLKLKCTLAQSAARKATSSKSKRTSKTAAKTKTTASPKTTTRSKARKGTLRVTMLCDSI